MSVHELPSRGLTPLPVDEASTPRDVEQRLSELYNDSIRAEMIRRARASDYRTAAGAKRRSRLLAVRSDECPRVSRSSPVVTVAMRQDWIDARIEEQVEDLHQAQDLLEDAMEYVRFLRSQISMMQTITGLVKQAYNLPQSGYGG